MRVVIRGDQNANGSGGDKVLCKSCVGLRSEVVKGGASATGEIKILIKANDIKELWIRFIRASLEIVAYLQPSVQCDIRVIFTSFTLVGKPAHLGPPGS
jgi:hypothetical protein